MWLKNPATALTETSILFTVRNPDERTDRLIPVYPLKHLSCGSIKRKKKTLGLEILQKPIQSCKLVICENIFYQINLKQEGQDGPGSLT